MRYVLCLTMLALLSVLLASPASSAGDGGEIAGSILSTGGEGLPGASMTIVHHETGRSWTVISGDRGLYRAGGLPAGSFEARVELSGYSPTHASIVLREGEARTLNLWLLPWRLTETVSVTAPAPRDSIEASDIRRSPARDAGEALSAVPGVWSLRKGGIANDVVLRGHQARDLSVLVDGARVHGACPNRMDPSVFHVDFAEVDRIEVTKGPFDVKNNGSMGGTVNVVTRRPESGWHASPNLAAGSWGYVNPSATVSYGRQTMSFLAGYSYRDSDPFRDGSGKRFTEDAGYRPDTEDDTAFRIGTAWANASFAPADGHALHVSYARQEADHLYYPYLQMDAIYDDTDRAGLSYEINRPGAAFEGLRAQAYYTTVNHWMTDEFRTSSTPAPPALPLARSYSMGTTARTRTAGGRLEARIHGATVGVETIRRFWDGATELAGAGYMPQYSIPHVVVSTTGLYAEAQADLGRHWTLAGGGRYDRARSVADEDTAATGLYYAYNDTRTTSRTDSYGSGNIRLIYKDERGLEVSGGVGSSVRLPDPVERFFGLKRMGSDWVGNPDLEPTRNTGADMSVSLRRSKLYLGGSVFANRLADYIAVHDQPRVNAVAGVMNTKARSYASTDAALRGLEVNTVVTLTDHLFFSGDASYVRGIQEAVPEEGILSRDMPEIPPVRIRSSLRYEASRFWADAEWVVSDGQSKVDTDLLETPTSGYGIVNIKGGARWRGLSVTAGVSNLLDRTYAEHLSYQRDPFRSGVKVNEPGRSFFVNVGYAF